MSEMLRLYLKICGYIIGTISFSYTLFFVMITTLRHPPFLQVGIFCDPQQWSYCSEVFGLNILYYSWIIFAVLLIYTFIKPKFGSIILALFCIIPLLDFIFLYHAKVEIRLNEVLIYYVPILVTAILFILSELGSTKKEKILAAHN